MKAQELASDQIFEETGEVAGLDFTSNRVGKCGRLSQLTDAVKEVYREIISRYAHSWIYLSERTLVTELKKKGHNFSKGAVRNHLKKLKARHKKVYLKPTLTEQNKIKRMEYCIDQIDKSHGRGQLKFKDNMNTIMVDESWFYVAKDGIKVLLVEDMDVTINPKVHHKSHIEKIMFLSVIGRPQKIKFEGEEFNFDGKIGLFPCTEEYITKRKSKKGPTGTRTAVNKNVDAEFYHNLFAEPGGVYDSIEAKMPWLRGKKFVIQQDGARPHTASDTISDLEKAGTGEGWTPIIMTQPPNSPDVNINDLGFFHSLKTRVRQKSSPYDSREEMMANVLKTFEEYPAETLDGIWGCYFNNLRSIMACDGGNDYKQAHNGGKKRQKSTGSAVDLSVNVDDYDRCKRLCNR